MAAWLDWNGQCTLAHEGDRVRVVEAEPRIQIAIELLSEMRSGRLHPDVSIDLNVITIRGVNRTVIYRLTDDPPTWDRCRYAEWPD